MLEYVSVRSCATGSRLRICGVQREVVREESGDNFDDLDVFEIDSRFSLGRLSLFFI